MKRRITQSVKLTDEISIGSSNPIVVQSMTNTSTANIEATVNQIIELYEAGSPIVRITVKDDEAAIAVTEIKKELNYLGSKIALVGDFHYNGHLLLSKHTSLASNLDKYRINPGNLGSGERHDSNFETIIKIAKSNHKAIRIGVNWGSLDQDLLTEFMNLNAQGRLHNRFPQLTNNFQKNILDSKEVIFLTMLESAMRSIEKAIELGLNSNQIILSSKISDANDLVSIYRMLAQITDLPLHLGLTEAGPPIKGMIASSAAMGALLLDGIGDTIRMSLTPEYSENQSNPLSKRTLEVTACQELLQALGLAYYRPSITSCPGCGRTSSNFFQKLADEINSYISLRMPEWKLQYSGVEQLKIAVMGCIVNGPGESKHADIGISLPGDNEEPSAPVFVDGEHKHTLKGNNIVSDFQTILENYIQERYSNPIPTYV